MFKPLSLYIGLRYIQAKQRKKFISFISLVSMLGIALSVAVLITVLSVMNGFDQQIQLRIFSLVPHITVTGMNNTLSDWHSVSSKVKPISGVVGVAPFVQGQALLFRDDVVHPVLIQGILTNQENQVSTLKEHIVSGSFTKLRRGEFGILLGVTLASYLGVTVGDQVNLMIPKTTVTPIGALPRFKSFRVVGLFDVGSGFGFNDTYAFINLFDAQKLYMLGQQVSGIQIRIKQLFAAESLSQTLLERLGPAYQIGNWTDQYGPFYQAVKMEKTMMFLILLLLVAIAAFNLVSGLVMLVNDKRADIAILRTIGATPKLIMRIFIFQGFLIGFLGTMLGVIGGILLSLNVTGIVSYIQRIFGVQLINANIYFVDYLPSQIQIGDIVHISIAALCLSLLATLYPAWSASHTEPAEALRYE